MLAGENREEISGKGFIYHAPERGRGNGLATAAMVVGASGLGIAIADAIGLGKKAGKNDCHDGRGYGGYGGYPYPIPAAYPCAPCGGGYETHRRDEDRGREDYRELVKDFVTQKELCLSDKLLAEKDKVAKLESELYTNNKIAHVEQQLCFQQNEITALRKELECCCKMEERDIREVRHDIRDAREDARVATESLRAYCDCTFIPQEKGYMDGRRVNFHRCEPFIGVQRQDLCACGPREEGRRDERCGERDHIG